MRRWLLAIAAACAWAPPARADDVRAPAPARPTGVVTKPPQVLQAQAPDYPPAALAAGKEARVKVRIHIDAAGTVTSVDVVAPVGDGFDEAAVAAAMQYVFDPAEIDGAPAAIAVETTINFVIEQREAPEAPPPPAPATHAGPINHAGASDQAITLQGTALERGTRRPLAGVIVSIAELALDAVTGDDGTFYFHGVPPGTYKVIAVDPRFER
ncbi:MAG TPA: TonB family protein, partial [Kofleriaceae bacterium]